MSKELVSNGNDFSVEWIDRAYAGSRRTALSVAGEDGSVTMGNLVVDADGVVTIGGTEVLSGTVADDLQMAANKDISFAAGTGEFDASLATGVTKTTTGLNTIGGDLLMAAGKILGFGAPQALSGAGACNVTTLVTNFTSTGGAQALTLANGTQAGQLKVVHHTVDGGSGVLTPATAGNFATFTLTNVHDACLLQWSGSAWNIVLNVGGTVA